MQNVSLVTEIHDINIAYNQALLIPISTHCICGLSRQMDIASLYRPAVGQIESLKKEFTIYKNKMHNVESPTPNKGDYRVSRYSNDAPENDKLDDSNYRRSSLVTPKHLPQDISPIAISVTSSVKRLASSRMTDSSPMVADPFGTTTSSLDLENAQAPSTSSNPVTPDSDEEASPINKPVPKISKDVAFGELHSEEYFHHTYENTLPATPEKENVDIDVMNEQFKNFGLSICKSGESNDEQSGKPGEAHNNDAFDASFQTEFPTSFSESPSPSKSNAFGDDFSDSFFMGPSVDEFDNDTRPLDGSRGNNVSPIGAVPNDEMDAPMDEAMALFPDSAFGSSLNKFETPTRRQEVKRIEEKKVLSPMRNAMHGNSRSEKVECDDDVPSDESRGDEEEHSPALVLKRLQQRRAKNISPTFPQNVTHKSGLSISEEIRKLDAIAKGETPSRGKRRSVKQPISYAEPTLNSKLRRGDVFFPKENAENEVNANANHNRDNEVNAQNSDALKDHLTNKATELHAS